MVSLHKTIFSAVFMIVILCSRVSPASTPGPPDLPRDYVTDLAGIMNDDARSRLSAYLQVLEQKTTAQVLVLTVQSLDSQSIEEFAVDTFKKWKPGRKGKDNGVLIVVAVKERKYRIEVGYGLESVLPDSMVGSIGRDYFVPSFKQGDYSSGIYAGTIVVVRTIAEHEGLQVTSGEERTKDRGKYPGRPLGTFQMIVLALFGIVALILFITHPGQCFLIILASQMGGGRGGWSGGGGGFGGGGFGGGGGGSSGGGGASGGW